MKQFPLNMPATSPVGWCRQWNRSVLETCPVDTDPAARLDGVRAALGGAVAPAKLSRQHNDANMLALAGDVLDTERARAIVRAWLDEPFEGGRHVRRVGLIDSLTHQATDGALATEIGRAHV